MLLEPFKEQLDLPTIFIQQSHILCANLPVIRQINECPSVLLAIKADSSKFSRIPFLSHIGCQADTLVKQDIILSVKHLVTLDNLVLDVVLFTDDKICLQRADIVQPRPIVIAFVKDIISILLIRDLVHCFDIVHISGRDVKECRYLSDYIKQGVYFNTSFVLAKGCPPENAQTKINGRRIEGIKLALQLKDTIDSLALSNTDKVICKLLKYPIISLLISLRKIAARNRNVTKSKPFCLSFVGGTKQNQLAQTTATYQLCKHHHQQLIPTCKRTHVLVALIFFYNSVEHSVGQQVHQLPKYIFTHRKSNLKIRPIRSKKCANNLTEDFYYLKHYK